MQFSYPPEAQELRAELQSWLAENLAADLRTRGTQAMFGGGEGRRDLTKARAWARKLYEGGWACIEWPKEHGGRDATAAQQVVFSEEVQRAGAPGHPGQLGITH